MRDRCDAAIGAPDRSLVSFGGALAFDGDGGSGGIRDGDAARSRLAEAVVTEWAAGALAALRCVVCSCEVGQTEETRVGSCSPSPLLRRDPPMCSCS